MMSNAFLFPYIADIETQTTIEIDGEIITIKKNINLAANVKFWDSSNIVVISFKKQDEYINFKQCKIKLNTSRNIYQNYLIPYKIIEDIDIIKLFCKLGDI